MLRRYYCLLLPILTLFAPMVEADAALFVSEIMADNDNTLSDEDGDSSDWIELYNDSTNAVSLEGWYLTDSSTILPDGASRPSTFRPRDSCWYMRRPRIARRQAGNCIPIFN